MASIGSLVFCTDCGNLLKSSTSHDQNVLLVCDVCGQQNQDTSSKTITSRSKPSAFPSALRAKHSLVQEVAPAEAQTRATIKMPCPQCGRPEMMYYTQQLRSADEGTTVFYECECGYRFNENN